MCINYFSFSSSLDQPPPPAIHQRYFQSLCDYILPEDQKNPDNPRWGRLVCLWNEKKPENRVVQHLYAASVDMQAQGLYLDSRPSKIFRICLAQLLVRPLHGAAKTLYHLALIPLF